MFLSHIFWVGFFNLNTYPKDSLFSLRVHNIVAASNSGWWVKTHVSLKLVQLNVCQFL